MEWRISLKIYGSTGTKLLGWGEIENGFDKGNKEKTVGSSGNIQPVSGITTASALMHPTTVPRGGVSIDIDYAPSTFTNDESDFLIFKIPLRITGDDI